MANTEQLDVKDLKSLSKGELSTLATTIRRELALLAIDLYGDRVKLAQKKRYLKKGLARVLTLAGQLDR